MELYIAGGCSEHGRNCFLVKKGDMSFIVDAGKMKEKPESPWPELTEKQVRKAKFLFLTHSHADHAGAVRHLLEMGFQGKIVAARATLSDLPAEAGKVIALEDLGKQKEEFRLSRKFHVMWGRSGHCVGSVWYRMRLGKKTILFTGDYEENSLAYKCDKLRGMKADLAVVDCAYGSEAEDSTDHLSEINEAMDRLVSRKKPLLFPVPSHGRGFDVLRLLADRGVKAVAADSFMKEYDELPDRSRWLKKSFLSSMETLQITDIREFEEAFRKTIKRRGAFPAKYMDSGILVQDSQLRESENRQIAEGAYARGGLTVLTGKQDPASFARRLFDGGKAEYHRISVHQNREEMMQLLAKNEFRYVIPFHSREELQFDEEHILALKTGDRVKFN
ncbi:MAG: MBL fold metallo-hydrolase [Lachnospiraceae bacterium]|nr:MBL fold metallo-hydrolase [Lachnospiraceae bacterium]